MSWTSFLNLKPEQPSLTKQLVKQPTSNVIQVTEMQILNTNGQQFGTIGTGSAEDRIVIIGDVSGRPQTVMFVDANGAGLFTAFNSQGGQAAS
jgi:hypothetical protein